MATDISKETKEKRLWSLTNAMEIPFLRLIANANKASAMSAIKDRIMGDIFYEEGLKALVNIEGAIKRFNENRPQGYEE